MNTTAQAAKVQTISAIVETFDKLTTQQQSIALSYAANLSDEIKKRAAAVDMFARLIPQQQGAALLYAISLSEAIQQRDNQSEATGPEVDTWGGGQL